MIDKSKFVNHFELSSSTNLEIQEGWDGPPPVRSILEIGQIGIGVDLIHGLLTPSIIGLLLDELDQHKWLAVGLDGRADHFYNEIGNYRLSNYSEILANRLWERLAGFFGDYLICNEFSPSTHDGHALWRPIGVNPLFRYIRYAEGGKLVGHYDDTFKQSDDLRSLFTLVIYLTNNQQGATRFLQDEQTGKPIADYDFKDWDRSGDDDEVLLRVQPQAGNALMFPHRMLHDSEPLVEGDPEKIIIRTDIMFERVL